jgi:pimeloyl-ACP methyl ester carboxylesterase
MVQALCKYTALVLAIIVATTIQPATAQSPPPRIGIVIMHGKGGSPTKHVADLVSSLEGKGYFVANLEMPWSGRRDYDVNVAGAEKEVESALDSLRAKGAVNLFVAGHSQGGLFALYFGGKHSVDGIVAIAPGGSVGSPIFREKLSESVEYARRLVADGKGNDKTRFLDFEGSKGTYPIVSTPANYLSWFDPDGAMNQSIAVQNVNPNIPVLFIGPKGDYPGLLKAKQPMFDALPRHPLTKLYEPDSNHLSAPSASLDEILRWTIEVANRANTALQGTSASGRP